MHELGLCSGIVDAVARRAGDRPVARVRVRVGCLHHVHPEAFAQSFELAAQGSVAEGAGAELVMVEATATCGRCRASWPAAAPPVACRCCGHPDVSLSGGDELTLELIEYRRNGNVPGNTG